MGEEILEPEPEAGIGATRAGGPPRRVARRAGSPMSPAMTAARLNPAALPDAAGHFGRFGGRFVPETLMAPLIELERAYRAGCADARFRLRLQDLLTHYAGRPTPLYFAERLTRACGGGGLFPQRGGPRPPRAHKNKTTPAATLSAVSPAERMMRRPASRA